MLFEISEGFMTISTRNIFILALVLNINIVRTNATLRVASTFIPPYYDSTNGKTVDTGPVFLFMDKLLKTTGLDYKWKTLPAKRLYTYLKKGRVNLFGGITQIPKSIIGKVIFSKCTLGDINVSLISLDEIQGDANSIKGKVGLTRGLTYLGLRKKYTQDKLVQVVDIATQKAALEMLRLKRVDYVLIYSGVYDSIDSINSTIPREFKKKIVMNSSMRVLISKETKNYIELRNTIDKGIRKIRPEYCNVKK
jgi:ABC-type amino acid transport substrate-binding protein